MKKQSLPLWLTLWLTLKHFVLRTLGHDDPALKEPINSKTWILIHDHLSEGQKNRLWEHHLHADAILYSRLSSFLTFESVLLAVVGILYKGSSQDKPMIIALVLLGIVLTLIWSYVQARQVMVLERSKAITREAFPEYQAISEDRNARKHYWPLSSVLLLNSLPPLVILIWIAILIYALLH